MDPVPFSSVPIGHWCRTVVNPVVYLFKLDEQRVLLFKNAEEATNQPNAQVIDLGPVNVS